MLNCVAVCHASSLSHGIQLNIIDAGFKALLGSCFIAPVPRRDGHISRFDTLVHLRQRGDGMSETQNQFSLTRAVSIIGGAAKKQIYQSIIN